MNTMTAKHEKILINPNWSAFVLLITLLSIINFFLLLLPLPFDAVVVIGMVNALITIILWADFLYRLRRAPDNRHFMIQDLGWMLLLGNFPYLHVLRLVWFWLMLHRNDMRLHEFLSQIVIKRNAGGTLLFIIFTVIVVFQLAVVFILDFEESVPGSNINSISDALWWAFATVTTVGYGDKVPITNGGRIVAVIMMALGIALFSVITGSLSEWFRGQPGDDVHMSRIDEDLIIAGTVNEIKQLLAEQERTYLRTIDELSASIAELEARLDQNNS